MDRLPSQGSTLTNTSAPVLVDSWTELSASESPENNESGTDALARGSHSKDGNADALPNFFFSLASDYVRELKHPSCTLSHPTDTLAQPASQPPRTPLLDLPRLVQESPFDYDPFVILVSDHPTCMFTFR